MGHKVTAVANAENWYSHIENFFGTQRRTLGINAVGASRKNNTRRVHCPNFVKRRFVGFYLAVYSALADASRNKLIVLTAEVEDDNKLV